MHSCAKIAGSRVCHYSKAILLETEELIKCYEFAIRGVAECLSFLGASGSIEDTLCQISCLCLAKDRRDALPRVAFMLNAALYTSERHTIKSSRAWIAVYSLSA